MKTVAAPVAGVTYIHTDGLGSPVAKSDANGNLIAGSRTRYEPYGMAVAGTATPTIGFTGHVNDADTGLTYMQQRYYDPVAGRFLSTDPVLTDYNTGASFNRYTYALNNPYKYMDPDGREPTQVFLVFTPLAEGKTTFGYHMFIKVVGDGAKPFYVRAGPSPSAKDSPSSTRVSSDATGTADRNKQAGYGNLRADVGDAAKRADAGDQKFQQYVGDIKMSVTEAATILTNFSNQVNASNIPYIPTSQNSNAFAAQAITTLGLPRPVPAATAVGSQTKLPVRTESEKGENK
ncbi:RHS repeat-associated core domain-containing protein [Undibacterium sp. LX15W]|uniref:RHS repeat-associated core domain-containing protein n=2 Tax=Undibacterium flavidum TaxID=2762297 RepID=A0ABR6YEC1_9BURK|nr:RHS repeat-associated core domain-containing protein [Undibacterium flavidum]